MKTKTAAEASCSEWQHGSHIDSMPTHKPLPSNGQPIVIGVDAATPDDELEETTLIKLGSDGGGDEQVLLCPKCGGDYLHHDQVKTFCREEDEETVVFNIDFKPPKVTKEIGNLSKNPSSRRDAVAIHFYCELCSYLGELTIAQHKGRTFLQWRRVGERIHEE